MGARKTGYPDPGAVSSFVENTPAQVRTTIKDRLLDMPLRYRLSIPFFFLALMGTATLVFLSIRSQNDLVKQQERRHLMASYTAFLHNMDIHGRWAVSLAANQARNPEIAAALAQRDRMRLIELCYPSYLYMRDVFGISQFNFHTAPPRAFVRMQKLYLFGDDLEYRHTIHDALAGNKETFGFEKGLTGYGIRGVAPVFHEGKIAGVVEIGFTFGDIYLEQMKKQFGVEATVLLPEGGTDQFETWATTLPQPQSIARGGPVHAQVFQDSAPRIWVRPAGPGSLSVVLVGPLKDYVGKTVGLVELFMSRSDTQKVIDHYRYIMLGVGIIGLLLSVGAIFLISHYFSRPIARMVDFARKIALEQQGQRMDFRPAGELGVLADALNDMLSSLDKSREQLQGWADNLEHMVHLRTRALRESEEKYRTVVENVPLVVYRLLGDGRTIFINHFIEDLLRVQVRDILQEDEFWKEKVIEEDRERIWPLMTKCLREGHEFKAEYRVRKVTGKIVHVLDHALPVLDEKGRVETVDGFLMDVTDRYNLQQQIIQTEELRTLSEISARLAHEIRNPLAAAGGFARRLLQSLGPDDPQKEKVQIIVSEVARLEKILERTLAYIQPFEVVVERISLNQLLGRILDAHERSFLEHSVDVRRNFSPGLESVSIDPVLIERALENLLRGIVAYCRPGGRIEVRTIPVEGGVQIDMIMEGVQISDDDVDHFFYPFTSRVDPTLTIDLPISKMIINKHKGIINLCRQNSRQLILTITLPH